MPRVASRLTSIISAAELTNIQRLGRELQKRYLSRTKYTVPWPLKTSVMKARVCNWGKGKCRAFRAVKKMVKERAEISE